MKKKVKKEMDTSFFDIKEFSDVELLYKILDTDIYTTYNQIMRCYENKEDELSMIIVVNSGDIFVQHLHLFCNYYEILLYKMPKNIVLEKKYRHVRVLGIPKNKAKEITN